MKYVTNILLNISSEALENYLDMVQIYSGKSSRKKTHLIEMIIYGCITNKINKAEVKDISTRELNKLLSEHKILVKSLPGHANKGMRKKDLKKPIE